MKKSKQLAFRGGSYSLVITVVVLAILIVVNFCASALPTTLTQYDISAAKIFSVTSNTKAILNNLDQEVSIYWITQANAEDKIIETLLNKYASMSSNVKVIKRNPDIYPTFAAKYTDQTVRNNSLVVESGNVFRFVPASDMYKQEVDMSTYAYSNSFDGEAAITSAINYVIREDHPCIYCLEGHGEASLPGNFNDLVTRANYDVEKLSLAAEGEIPENAACIVIYAPTSDINEEEKDMLAKYVSGGGKLLAFSGPTENGPLENLHSILSDYAVTMVEHSKISDGEEVKADGIVLEENPRYFAFQQPFMILPTMAETEITRALIEAEYKPTMAVSAGLSVGETSRATLTPLLTTSENYSFSKAAPGLSLKDYTRVSSDMVGEGVEDVFVDVDGPFALAIDINDKTGGEIIWFASSEFLSDVYNSYSSGANDELAMNALSSLVGEGDKLEIRSKSLNYNYLTISETQGSRLKILMIGAIPVLYLCIGICSVVETRRKQNEETE